MANDSVIVDNSEEVIEDERDANGTITIGALVVPESGGNVAEHATDGDDTVNPAVAGLPFDMDTEKGEDLADGERTRIIRRLSGVATRVPADADVSDGDLVVTNGTGGVRAYNSGGGDTAAMVLGQAESAEGGDGAASGEAIVRWW